VRPVIRNADTLAVPGAQLHYEVSGTGPVLLTIPGGPADAATFAALAGALADRYTVVRYDPRGVSRSSVEAPAEASRFVQVHGDDAHRLLAALGDEPALVLGSSGGAVIGLELAARHPEQVRTLVAHEPPVIRLLPDADAQLAVTEEVYQIFRREGWPAAVQRFLANAGLEAGAAQPADPEAAEAMARMRDNFDFFLAHYLRPISGYEPDLSALRSGSTRVVVGIGDATGGQLANRCAVTVAERLGLTPVVFPGDHNGFASRPAEFAKVLDGVLRAS
jgi:pimeloyl-ACP methyl ester carboxylesterase